MPTKTQIRTLTVTKLQGRRVFFVGVTPRHITHWPDERLGMDTLIGGGTTSAT